MSEVIIYRNLLDRVRHNGKWSIAAIKGRDNVGKVIGHADDVTLSNVRFVVKEKRRQVVAAGGHREVHAWAVGTVAERPAGDAVDITYRPHQCGSFICRDNGDPITSAAHVRFASDGRAAAFGVAPVTGDLKRPRGRR
jgi:hypothetical protein